MSLEHSYWRFRDLKARGIVNNRMTLHRWIKSQGFPQGTLLGPNSRAWTVQEIITWLDGRPIFDKLKSTRYVDDEGHEHSNCCPPIVDSELEPTDLEASKDGS